MNTVVTTPVTLSQDILTFGKYKGCKLSRVLRDRNYCQWLLEQDWFQTNYEFLYNRIKEFDPKVYFLNTEIKDTNDFMSNYTYFNLTPLNELKIDLSEGDKICYQYYLQMIDTIRDCIYLRLENEEENPYDIKAPTRWLKRFEQQCGMPRTEFKEFLDAYELPNIPYIIERIKKEGGITYKGAQSFKIAKERSLKQEHWWEQILKSHYGENIGTQFKYRNCIFDFINIATHTIYECKLGLKDFDETQHAKYRVALEEYKIIYLIGKDGVIDMNSKKLYTTKPEKYQKYIMKIPLIKEPSYLDIILEEFEIIELENITSIFN